MAEGHRPDLSKSFQDAVNPRPFLLWKERAGKRSRDLCRIVSFKNTDILSLCHKGTAPRCIHYFFPGSSAHTHTHQTHTNTHTHSHIEYPYYWKVNQANNNSLYLQEN